MIKDAINFLKKRVNESNAIPGTGEEFLKNAGLLPKLEQIVKLYNHARNVCRYKYPGVGVKAFYRQEILSVLIFDETNDEDTDNKIYEYPEGSEEPVWKIKAIPKWIKMVPELSLMDVMDGAIQVGFDLFEDERLGYSADDEDENGEPNQDKLWSAIEDYFASRHVEYENGD